MAFQQDLLRSMLCVQDTTLTVKGVAQCLKTVRTNSLGEGSNVATNSSNLITVVTLNGTTGGFLTGSGDLVNAGGYAVTSVDCSGTGDVKGIPVDVCSATVDATKTPITAKLINSESLLDAMTPALPVYFGSEINMKSEEISGLIIAGDSTSTFYLDTREGTALAAEPAMTDLQPVFQIVQGSEIEDGDARRHGKCHCPEPRIHGLVDELR